MNHRYQVAVVGSGPGGLSAAARAAQAGVSHILLEATPNLANTISRYQKGKFVMAEPGPLPLRSPLSFQAGSREQVLEAWQSGLEGLTINLRHNAEVKAIAGRKGDFTLTLSNNETAAAEHVVLAIGLQGNLRTLTVPGAELPFIQYQLDDPGEYRDETIAVIGAGDAAIENALALAEQNTVILINRRDEFSRAKEGNLNAVLRAIDQGLIRCLYNSSPARIEAPPAEGKACTLVLKSRDGEAKLPCNRIIARLGAIPPRKFVESCGIHFPNEDPNAVPAVSDRYESNVPGLYIIGALAGYPLIKQAMNQGYEVIEFIQGNPVEPADEPLLREKFRAIPGAAAGVGTTLAMIQRTIPLFADLTTLQLREFILDSRVLAPAPGEAVFRYNDYTDTFFSILRGEVNILTDPDRPEKHITLRAGQFFGEMSLISGRRRSATVLAGEDCVLIETPRRSMIKLINSVASTKRLIDEVFLLRAIQTQLAPSLSARELNDVVRGAAVASFNAGEVLFREGEPGDSLHLIRRGSVTVSRDIGGREVVLSYVPAGNYIGETALLINTPRTATVRATVATETVRLDGSAFRTLLQRQPLLYAKMRKTAQERLAQTTRTQNDPEVGNIVSFLVKQGLGEATDVLLIDESLCVHCDNCERACAETHGGISRLDRKAGPTFASVHVPTSCRHCEHPHCMKDCPPDAIHRAPNGEVFIDDTCIGCGNCEQNCPYGVIQMGYVDPQRKPSLLSWLLLGTGIAPGQEIKTAPSPDAAKVATKCDMCKELEGGPACVRACPTGAAIRVGPEEFMDMTR